MSYLNAVTVTFCGRYTVRLSAGTADDRLYHHLMLVI
jgi:hypothetical protein